MNKSERIVAVIVVTMFVMSIFLLNKYETTKYVSINNCCVVELSKVDNQHTRIKYNDFVYSENYNDVILNSKVDSTLVSITGFCKAHHH